MMSINLEYLQQHKPDAKVLSEMKETFLFAEKDNYSKRGKSDFVVNKNHKYRS